MITEGTNRIAAAAEIATVDHVAQAYADEYKDRYGVTPIWESVGMTIVKDLTRNVGEKKARQLLKAYVRMNDEWFVQQGHSLECFKKNIPRVNAFLGSKIEKVTENRGIRIITDLSCDECFGVFPWVGNPNDLNGVSLRHCPECLGEAQSSSRL